MESNTEELNFAKENTFFTLSNDQIKTENGHVQFDTTVQCKDSDKTENITIEFKHAPTFDPNYESEEIKTIKESKLIPEDEIKFENGYMFFKDGGFSIDTPYERDFNYRFKYVQNHNKQTKESLQDKQLIEFHHANYNSDAESDEYGECEENDDKYGLHYEDFISNKKVEFKNPDEIVLAQSYIKVYFNSPTFRDHVMFTIHADDEMKGFTRKELAYKCMKYYHMQYYLSQNYDLDKGCFVTNNAIKQVYNKDSEFHQAINEYHRQNPSMDWLFKEPEKTINIPEPIFRPVLFYDEYTDNGLDALEYNKEKDYWIFLCLTYV